MGIAVETTVLVLSCITNFPRTSPTSSFPQYPTGYVGQFYSVWVVTVYKSVNIKSQRSLKPSWLLDHTNPTGLLLGITNAHKYLAWHVSSTI